MAKTMKITPYGQKILNEKHREFLRELAKVEKTPDKIRETVLRNNIADLENVLDSAVIYEFSESNPAQVILGARITLENLINGDRREYVILNRSAADPLKGVISNESPLAQKMLGLKLGNTFKFKDIVGIEEGFKIISIE